MRQPVNSNCSDTGNAGQPAAYSRLAVLVNGMVARGELDGPIAFSRDLLDAASAGMPYLVAIHQLATMARVRA